MEKRTLIIIIVAISLAVIALVLGLALGLTLNKKDDDKEQEIETGVVNSYDNTEELIKTFKVINPTTVKDGLEKNIQNRLLTGFANWNRGFETWKEWGNILYTKDSIYNVHGARLTLEHYQEDMFDTLGKMQIDMGNFNNMLIVGNYCAIYYDISIRGRSGTTMEFVQFKDYGNTSDPDVRVVEGWGGVKDDTYYDSKERQGSSEKKVQEEQDNFLLYYIPEESTTIDLTEKYFIKYETDNEDPGNKIRNIILAGFESWNKGIDDYKIWVDTNFDTNAKSKYGDRERDVTKYKEEITDLFKNETITKLYFDNFLIRDNWAAIHYRFRSEDVKNTLTRFGDRIEFFKFEEKNGQLKIIGNWLK